MSNTMKDFRKHAKKYVEDIDLEGLMDSIDFSKVDTKKLKQIDFSKGMEAARKQLEDLPKARITTEPEHDSEKGFIGGMLLGMLLGAILALLFAPKSGEETREMMAHTVEDIKDKVAGEADYAEVSVEDAVNRAEEEAEETFADVEAAIERNFG